MFLNFNKKTLKTFLHLRFIANLLLRMPVKWFRKAVNILRSYEVVKYSGLLLRASLYIRLSVNPSKKDHPCGLLLSICRSNLSVQSAR